MCLCVWIWVCTHSSSHVEVRGQLSGVIFSHVSPGEQTQVARFGSWCLHLLNQLTSPGCFVFWDKVLICILGWTRTRTQDPLDLTFKPVKYHINQQRSSRKTEMWLLNLGDKLKQQQQTSVVSIIWHMLVGVTKKMERLCLSYRHIFGNHWGLGIVAITPGKECIRNKRSQAWWWHRPLMPALRRQKQVDWYELEASLVYIVEFQGQPSLYSETCLKNKHRESVPRRSYHCQVTHK